MGLEKIQAAWVGCTIPVLITGVKEARTLKAILLSLANMYTKNWHVIRDDSKRTFEVVTNSMSENAFTNKTQAMQRDGMNVSFVLLPVSNKNASKAAVNLTGYTKEDGLYDRLLKQHAEIGRKNIEEW